MVLKPSGKWEMIYKNQDSFDTVPKLGNYGKIWTVVKLSVKWETIQKNPDAAQVSAPLQFAMTRL